MAAVDFPNVSARPRKAEFGPVTGLEAAVHESFAAEPRNEWNRLYGDSAESYDYYRACEAAPPDMFKFGAVTVRDDRELVAGAPVFTATFRLDMALEGRLRTLTDSLHRLMPRALSLRVLGAGSPHADELALAMEPGFGPPQRAAALGTLLQAIDAYAKRERIGVLFVKDVTDSQAQWTHETFKRLGYARLPTLPVAHLELPFDTEEEYLASLSGNMRSNLRRKLKQAKTVEVEVRDDVQGIEHEISALRAQTQEQAKANYGDFEQLSEGYFREVMQHMPGRAKLLLYRVAGELIGFSLILIDKQRLTYKYTGMRYPVAREHNLYFVNWMTMVRLCLSHGIRHLHAGETTYLTKTRLGCKLERSWIYFRHRNPLVNQVFKRVGPRIAIDKMDPDLRELGGDAPYIVPRT